MSTTSRPASTSRFPPNTQHPLLLLFFISYVAFLVIKSIQFAHQATLKYSYAQGVFYDLSDHQWRTFSQNLPKFLMVLVSFIFLKKIVMKLFGSVYHLRYGNVKREADELMARVMTLHYDAMRVRVLHAYYVIANSAILYVLHGSDFFIVLLPFISVIYLISSVFKKSKLSVVLTWILCIVALFVCEYKLVQWRGGRLRGLYRVNVAFNMTFLRLVSFVFDRWDLNARRLPALSRSHRKKMHNSAPIVQHTSLLKSAPKPHVCDVCNPSTGAMCYSERVKYGTTSDDEFGYFAFLSYVLYFPLYIAGPITTFNAFESHLKKSQTSHSTKDLMVYAARVAFGYLCLEFILRYIHAPRLLRMNLNALRRYTTGEVSALCFWNLIFLYCKFNFIWKLFRFAALLDGVEAPENMNRCAFSAFSISLFWKNWHASYNLWLLRYVYIPLGGNRQGKVRQILSILLVFTFVALWHDITLHLLAWGWLLSLVYIPEVLASRLASKWQDRWWYEWAIAVCGAVVVFFVTLANVVGFVFGLEGMGAFWEMMFEGDMSPLLVGLSGFPMGIMVTLNLRKYERFYGVRKGIA
uniref:Glycerol uptake protein n=1 Tax=Percolomonas cosmopolitus TaxID=63605 RepID=A0A7S1PFR6_9EUKA